MDVILKPQFVRREVQLIGIKTNTRNLPTVTISVGISVYASRVWFQGAALRLTV